MISLIPPLCKDSIIITFILILDYECDYDYIEEKYFSTMNIVVTDDDDKKVVGVILTGHDGRRAIVHHLCVHPDFRRMGIARMLVERAEEALRLEGITKIFGLVFKDNDAANCF